MDSFWSQFADTIMVSSLMALHDGVILTPWKLERWIWQHTIGCVQSNITFKGLKSNATFDQQNYRVH
jgi:hypothetical protein